MSCAKEKLVPKIMEYAEKQCPEDALRDAWDDYYRLGTRFEENHYRVLEN